MFTSAIIVIFCYFDKFFFFVVYISCSVESQEVLDAELSARVLQLINVTDNGLHSQVYQLKHKMAC